MGKPWEDGDCTGIYGDFTGIYGDFTGICGDFTGKTMAILMMMISWEYGANNSNFTMVYGNYNYSFWGL